MVATLDSHPWRGTPIQQQQQQQVHELAFQRRRQIGHCIYSLWTEDGSNIAGLVEPWLDGRMDVLGLYMMMWICEEEEDDIGGMQLYDIASPLNTLSSSSTVDRIPCDELTYENFVKLYMQPQIPVLIENLAVDWKASQEWTSRTLSHNSQDSEKFVVPNLDYLRSRYGHDQVKVMEQASAGLGSSRPVERRMTLAEFADYWIRFHSAFPSASTLPLLYLKDYRLVALHPEEESTYQWPHFFRDDWLNDATDGEYRFVYIGPKGSSTVLHADVLRSYSWSTNVCGRKRWWLVAPRYTPLLWDCFGRTLATHLEADIGELATLFPGLAHVRRRKSRGGVLHILQEAGETLFVSSNVFHTVENLAPTISINHNWLNGYNVNHCWKYVHSEIQSQHQAVMDHRFSLPFQGPCFRPYYMPYTVKAGNAENANHTWVNHNDVQLKAANGMLSCAAPQNGQVVDADIMLLWKVISHHIQSLLAHFNPSSLETTAMATPFKSCSTELAKIRAILLDLLKLISASALTTINKNDVMNLDKLMSCMPQ